MDTRTTTAGARAQRLAWHAIYRLNQPCAWTRPHWVHVLPQQGVCPACRLPLTPPPTTLPPTWLQDGRQHCVYDRLAYCGRPDCAALLRACQHGYLAGPCPGV